MEIKTLLRLRSRRAKRASKPDASDGSAQIQTRVDALRRDAASGIPGVHAPEQTRRILRRERNICDRSGGTLSLVTFSTLDGAFADEVPDPEMSAVEKSRARKPIAEKFADERSTDALSLLASLLSWRLSPTGAMGSLDRGQLAVVLPDTSISAAHAVARDAMDAAAEQHDGKFEYAVFIYPSHEFAAQAGDDGDGRTEPLQAHPMEALFAKPTPKWKRLIDITAAVAGIVLLSPLLLIVSLAIKLASPGPIFFVQDREGIGGRRFRILKFRTMCVDAERRKADFHELNQRDGPAFKIRNDPRATRLGNILRRTCIDELPQLWNVLKGDMSLVGPRPLPWDESRACHRWHRRRLDVAPGLTCTWQLHGGFDRSFDEWMHMDIDYAENLSPWNDSKLILQTMWRVVLLRASH